jgi:hypothetical protein
LQRTSAIRKGTSHLRFVIPGLTRNPESFRPPILDSGFRRNDKLMFIANEVKKKPAPEGWLFVLLLTS